MILLTIDSLTTQRCSPRMGRRAEGSLARWLRFAKSSLRRQRGINNYRAFNESRARMAALRREICRRSYESSLSTFPIKRPKISTLASGPDGRGGDLSSGTVNSETCAEPDVASTFCRALSTIALNVIWSVLERRCQLTRLGNDHEKTSRSRVVGSVRLARRYRMRAICNVHSATMRA